MYATGDILKRFKASSLKAEFWDLCTVLLVRHFTEGGLWNGVFWGLATMSVKVIAGAAVEEETSQALAKYVSCLRPHHKNFTR